MREGGAALLGSRRFQNAVDSLDAALPANCSTTEAAMHVLRCQAVRLHDE